MEVNKLKPVNVIIYTRVSSQEQIQNYSLETQLKACEEYCNKQDWKIVEIFKEEGESAKSANRTELLKLIDYCSKNKSHVDILLVYKLDRFARNSTDHHGVRALLLRYGVVLRSVSEPIDESPIGKFMEGVISSAAQFDNDVRSERSKGGLKEKVYQGYWAWHAPLGYKNSPTGLIIDKEKAPLMIKMFDIYSQGNETIKSLTVKLNRWGLRNKNGKKLYAQTVTRMLQNKLYMGIIQVPKWDYEGQSLEPKLINPTVFYKCEAVRNRKVLVTAPRLIKNPNFPLKSIAYCQECSHFLTGSNSKGRDGYYPYYHCAKCDKSRFKKNDLEYAFIKKLKEIQPNPEIKRLFKEVLIDVYKQKLANKLEGLGRVDKVIINLKARKSFLLNKNMQGIVSDSDYKEAIADINTQIEINEMDRSDLREEETSIDHLLALAENILSNVALLWFEAPFEDKLRFQSLVFPNGFYFDGENIRTTALGLPFSLIQEETITNTHLVPPTGFEPVITGMKTRRPNH